MEFAELKPWAALQKRKERKYEKKKAIMFRWMKNKPLCLDGWKKKIGKGIEKGTD